MRDVDVAIIGAGAAGISAARTLIGQGASVMLVEALPHIGGRCRTDHGLFGIPADLGAHWLHNADISPLPALARDLGLELYADGNAIRLMVGGREATADELANYQRATDNAEQAIIRLGQRGEDVAATQALLRDQGEWRGPVQFHLGPYECGKALADISALDFARSPLGPDMFVRNGLGTLVTTLGHGLPVSLDTDVRSITVAGHSVTVTTSKGTFTARCAIVTASMGVLAQGNIRFDPLLPAPLLDAINGLSMASYEHVIMELAGNPLALGPDTGVYLKSDSQDTFAALANAGGSNLWYVDTGGTYAKALAHAGADAAIDAAKDWMASMFGAEIKGKIVKAHATSWQTMPSIAGAFSCAAPGKANGRAMLREPHAGRVLFAGEAAHDTLWGSVAGAWESGQASASKALAIVRG